MIIENKLIKYVIFKKRTEYEIKQKCKQLNYTEEYTEEIIEYLKEAGYINDKIYITKYIDNIIKLKKVSLAEVKMDLLKRGIDINNLEAEQIEKLEEHEEKSAIYLAQKKSKAGEETEKIRRYLGGKGYQYSTISKAIESLTEK